MNGQLIIISGYSGAGKSTLINGSLKNLAKTKYLHTVTTRPKRQGESSSIEYDFVSEHEYEMRRAAAKMWDHVDYQGFKYGVDIDWVYQNLKAGTNLICAIAPDPLIYIKLKKLYGDEPISIWIDTDKATSDIRIKSDKIRSGRLESRSLKEGFQYSFHPQGIKDADIKRFQQFVSDLLL